MKVDCDDYSLWGGPETVGDWRGHDWPSKHMEVSGNVIPVGEPHTCVAAQTPIVKEKVSYTEIEIEDLGDDLLSDVRTQSSKATPPPARVCDHYFSQHVDHAKKMEDGTFLFTFESIIEPKDISNFYDAWLVFHADYLKVISQNVIHVEVVNGVYRVRQSYLIGIPKNTSKLPLLQLYCNIRKMKCMDTVFEEGDIATFFIHGGHFSKSTAMPAMISVAPKYQKTYLAIRPRQRIQIIMEDHNEDYVCMAGGAVKYDGDDRIKNAKRPSLNYKTFYYEATKFDTASEALTIKRNQDVVKSIYVMPIDNKSMCVIEEPEDKAIIYAYNINGFIFRTKRMGKSFKFKIDKSSGLKMSYMYKMKEEGGGTEIKLLITDSAITHFVLERHDWGCLVK